MVLYIQPPTLVMKSFRLLRRECRGRRERGRECENRYMAVHGLTYAPTETNKYSSVCRILFDILKFKDGVCLMRHAPCPMPHAHAQASCFLSAFILCFLPLLFSFSASSFPFFPFFPSPCRIDPPWSPPNWCS